MGQGDVSLGPNVTSPQENYRKQLFNPRKFLCESVVLRQSLGERIITVCEINFRKVQLFVRVKNETITVG